MEKTYKQTRLIAFILIAVLVVSHLIDIEAIGSFTMLVKQKSYEQGEWVMNYNWLGGIIGILEIALYTWFFVLVFSLKKMTSSYKMASIIAFVGLGLVLINNLVYAGTFFFSNPEFSLEDYYSGNKIRALTCLYPGRILFSVAILLVARTYPRTSTTFFGGFTYLVYIIIITLYGLLMMLFGNKLITADHQFWYVTLFIIIGIVAEIVFLLFIFGFSKGKPEIAEETDNGEDVKTEVVACEGNNKKVFFLKRWMVGLSNWLDKILFNITPGSEDNASGLFWMLIIVGFCIGGVSMAVSFFKGTGGSESIGIGIVGKLVVFAAFLSIVPLTLYIIKKTCRFDKTSFRLVRGFYILLWSMIGLAFGYVLGLIVVAVVIFVVVMWLLLKILGTAVFGDSGNGTKRKWKLDNGTEVTEGKDLFGEKTYSGNDGFDYDKVSDDTFKRQ